jgi:predicted secreted protein
MTKINGTLFRLKVGNYLVGSTTDSEFSLEQDDPKTTNQDGNGWEESLEYGGIRRASGSANGMVDPDNNYNSEEAMDEIINNSALLTAQFGVVGGTYYTCKIKITSIKLSGSTETPVTYSVSWVSSGAVSKATAMTS